MAMFDSNIDYTKFIQFSGGTLRVATFVEIRDALIKRYKEIYGNDIDISTASADGQYINEIALIINNIVNTFSYAYEQLDPSVARGKYLDILCSYNNIQRINKSASIAELYIFNNSPIGTPDEEYDNLTFIDRNGQTWTWINPKGADGNMISFPAQKATPIENVECDTLGAVAAYGSRFLNENNEETDDIDECDWNKECPASICKLINYDTNLRIWQYKNAIIGNEEETDESLRSRRYQMLGNQSVSILDALESSLLNISGISDAFIINNSNNTPEPLSEPVNDGTDILPHSIYIALRYKDNVNIDKSIIGKLIYNKLTPGIGTTPFTYSSSTSIYDDTTEGFESYTIQKTEHISYTIFWKKCQSIKPEITLNCICNSYYDFPSNATTLHSATTDVEKNIVKNLQTYINEVKINSYLQISRLLNIIQQSDIQKNGVSTFLTKNGNIKVDNLTYIQNYPSNLSYFKYDNEDYKFLYGKSTPDIEYYDAMTIEIG